MRLIAVLLPAAALAACVPSPPQSAPPPPPITVDPRVVPPTQAPPPPPVAGYRTPEIMQGPGLSAVIRQPASALVSRFGTPRLDTPEGDMRKLQFRAEACVLDVYLYPLAPNAEPVATWVEARRASDGAEVDRAACIRALSRRG